MSPTSPMKVLGSGRSGAGIRVWRGHFIRRRVGASKGWAVEV